LRYTDVRSPGMYHTRTGYRAQRVRMYHNGARVPQRGCGHGTAGADGGHAAVAVLFSQMTIVPRQPLYGGNNALAGRAGMRKPGGTGSAEVPGFKSRASGRCPEAGDRVVVVRFRA